MGQDVGPGFVAEHEEHEDVEKAQEVDVDGAYAVVAIAASKDGYGIDGHEVFPCFYVLDFCVLEFVRLRLLAGYELASSSRLWVRMSPG